MDDSHRANRPVLGLQKSADLIDVETARRLLTTSLYVIFHELLSVLFENIVDLVE